MPAQAELQWKSDGTQAEATVSKLEKGYARLASQMERLAAASSRAAGASKAGWDESAEGADKYAVALGRVAAAATAAMAVLQSLRAEQEEQLRRQKEAAGAQVGAADAMRNARKAFQADPTMRADQLEPRLLGLAAKHGAGVPLVGGVAAEALSAKGAATNAQAMSAIEAAVRVSPTDQNEATVLAARYLDLMNAGGIQDARQVGGFIGQLQANSRVKNMTQLGGNLVPAINSLMAGGNSMEQAGEIVATLNNLMSDAEGAVSKTAAIGLGSKLSQFVPKERAEDDFGKFAVPKEQIAAYEAARGQNTAEQIRVMQENPELRRAFFSKNTFEAEATAPVKALLSGAPNAVAAYKAVREGIAPVDERMAAEFEKQVEFYNSGGFQGVADIGRRGAAAEEQKNLRDRMGAMRGAAFEQYERVLRGVDLPGPDEFNIPGVGDVGSRGFRLSAFKGAPTGVDAARMAEEDFRFLSQHTAVSGDDKVYLAKAAEEMAATRQLMEQLLAETRKVASSNEKMAADRPEVRDRPLQEFGR